METYSPSTIKSYVKAILEGNQVPFVQGNPGLGKSSIIKEVADELGLKVIDVRLSQVEPVDLLGLPDLSGKKACYKPFDMFPLEGDKIPEGYNGWLLFFDEFNSAQRDVQAASYRIVLDREVGTNKLHENVRICCAGNLSTDRAIVNKLSSALQSRLVHLFLHVSFEDWLEWAQNKGIDYRITSFLTAKKDFLLKFNPNSSDFTFPCPRTWEILSNIIKGKEDLSMYRGIIDGAIGEGAGTEFFAYVSLASKMPTINDVVADPENAIMPTDTMEQYYMSTILLQGITPDNCVKVFTYAKRFEEKELIILLFTNICKNKSLHDQLKTNNDFLKISNSLHLKLGQFLS